MKKTIVQSSSLARIAKITLPSLFTLGMLFTTSASAHKEGYYGGMGTGRVSIDFDVKKFFDEFVDGTKVDLGQYYSLVNQFADKEGLCVGIICNPGLSDIKAQIKTITIDNKSEPVITDFFDKFDDDNKEAEEILKRSFDDPGSTNYVLRVFGGYNFKKFFGIELAGFATTTLTTQSKDISVNYNPPGTAAGKYLISTQVDLKNDTTLLGVELLGTLTLPLDPFYVYAKAGVAYVNMLSETKLTITGKVRTIGSNTTDEPQDEDKEVFSEKKELNNGRVRPVMAAGIAYRASKDVYLDLSYQRYNFSNSKSSSSNGFLNQNLGGQPSLNFVLLSIVVGFSETKCGDLNC